MLRSEGFAGKGLACLCVISTANMDEFAERPPVQPLASRQWSCGTLLEGVASVLHDCEIDLPDDLEQLEACFMMHIHFPYHL